MNKNLEAPNAQTLFEKIFHYDYDLGFALNEIEKLQLSNIYFFNDFLREFNNQYLDIFDAVTQEDIDLLINNYKDVEPPHVWLDDFQFKAFYPFIKEYNNGLYISNKNVTGIKPSSDKMYKVYKFSDMLSEIYPNIIFEKFSFEDRFKNLNLFFELEQAVIKLQKSLVLPPEKTKKLKPKLNESLILFSSPEIIDKLQNELKGYFEGNEKEFQRALNGEQLDKPLLFPSNQNKFVEVFKRLKYNGYLLSTPKEIKDWICSNFMYQYNKGLTSEVRSFNTSTVHDILTKDKGEPKRNERIYQVDWLPYKSHLTRQREAEKEKT